MLASSSRSRDGTPGSVPAERPVRTDPSHLRRLGKCSAGDVAAGVVGLGAARGELVLAGRRGVVLGRREILPLAERPGIGLQGAGIVERVGDVGIGHGHAVAHAPAPWAKTRVHPGRPRVTSVTPGGCAHAETATEAGRRGRPTGSYGPATRRPIRNISHGYTGVAP